MSAPQQPLTPFQGVIRSIRVWSGKNLAPFTGKNLFSVSKHNEQLQVTNVFLKPQIRVVSGASRIIITDSGWSIEVGITDIVAAGGGTNPNPPPSNVSVKRLRLKSVQGDYVTCHSWDGLNEGATPVYVAKHYKLRNSIASETKFGVPYTYAYTAGQDTNNIIRTGTPNGDHTQDEHEMVAPLWLVNDDLLAVSATPGVNGGDGNPVGLQMLDPRMWTKF